jgi:hypothetical protein
LFKLHIYSLPVPQTDYPAGGSEFNRQAKKAALPHGFIIGIFYGGKSPGNAAARPS